MRIVEFKKEKIYIYILYIQLLIILQITRNITFGKDPKVTAS